MSVPILQLFLLALTFNIFPEFVPPTSLLLSFFYILTHTNIFLLTLVTVAGAAIGRTILYYVSGKIGKKILSDNVQEGYAILRKIVHKNDFITVFFMALYSISPLSTATVFIVAGVARIKLYPIVTGYVIGRFIQYMFIALTVKQIYNQFEDILGQGFFNPVTLGLSFLGMIGAILLITLDWEQLLQHKKIVFHRKIFKSNKH